MVNLEECLFITVCSNTKNPESFERAMPLCEMYTGQVYCTRVELLKMITDEIYISSLLGPGIVLDTYVDYGYVAPPPPILKKYVKDPNFSKGVREKFEARYPGRIEKVKQVYFLGDSNYDECIKQIFRDKEVVICLNKKLAVGQVRGFMQRVIKDLKSNNDVKQSKHYEYKDWVFEYVANIDGTSCCKLYKKENDSFKEVDLFNECSFIEKFRELTGNLTSREYCESVGCANGKRIELTHPVMKKYFEKILNIQPSTTPLSNVITYDCLKSGVFDKRFVDLLKNL